MFQHATLDCRRRISIGKAGSLENMWKTSSIPSWWHTRKKASFWYPFALMYKMIDHVVVYEKRVNLGALMCKKVLIGLFIMVIVSKIK